LCIKLVSIKELFRNKFVSGPHPPFLMSDNPTSNHLALIDILLENSIRLHDFTEQAQGCTYGPCRPHGALRPLHVENTKL